MQKDSQEPQFKRLSIGDMWKISPIVLDLMNTEQIGLSDQDLEKNLLQAYLQPWMDVAIPVSIRLLPQLEFRLLEVQLANPWLKDLKLTMSSEPLHEK